MAAAACFFEKPFLACGWRESCGDTQFSSHRQSSSILGSGLSERVNSYPRVITMSSVFPPNRESALSRLEEFLPKAGKQYAEKRNYDFGPDNRDNVSMLSPYLSHRLLTEREVVEAVLSKYKPKEAESFIQEVVWRTYWKGWLEGRPSVYSA